jgi:hypothetical protein
MTKDQQLSALWIGRNASGTLVNIVMETPGTRITMNAEQAAMMAEMLLHHAGLARQRVFEREIAESN